MKTPEMFKIKPGEGMRVKDPLTFQLLAPEGELKPRNAYWDRRLKYGDVVEVIDAPKKSPKTEQPKPSKE